MTVARVSLRTHLVAQLVNAGISSDAVRVILGSQTSEDDCTTKKSPMPKPPTVSKQAYRSRQSQHLACPALTRDGNHVLNGVVTVSKVGQWSLLVDNTNGSFLGANFDVLDVVRRFAQVLELLVQDHTRLSGGLSVELGRERDLEQNVLHNVVTVRPLELELVALEQDVVETPGLGRQYGRDTHLTTLNGDGQVNSALARVTG